MRLTYFSLQIVVVVVFFRMLIRFHNTTRNKENGKGERASQVSFYVCTLLARLVNIWEKTCVCVSVCVCCGYTSNRDEMAIHLILERSPSALSLSGEKKKKRVDVDVIKLFN